MSDSWLKTAVNTILGRDETPEPPKRLYRAIAQDFARHNPEATVGDWVEFFASGCEHTWKEAWKQGYECKLLGVQEQPFDIEDDTPEYLAEVPVVALDKVVPLQQGGSMRNVVFTDEDGLAVLEGEDE